VARGRLARRAVDPEVAEQVTLSGRREHELTVLLPHLAFHEPVTIRAGEK
jgi:hypothetical protein